MKKTTAPADPAPQPSALTGGLDGLMQRRSPHGIKPSLESITALMTALGNPHRKLACIHVAGTNGKGSVCAMIEAVLRQAGFKTGLYTSPHLFRLNERIRIAGVEIPDTALEHLLQETEHWAEKLEAQGVRRLTFFEITTAAAFTHFARSGVELAVIETGMGGRWDATNLIIPLLSVITRIDLDHADFLGSRIEGIAAEKAGIIKPGRPVVTAPMPEPALTVLRQQATALQALLLESASHTSIQILGHSPTGQKLRIETAEQTLAPVHLPLTGQFQAENCAVAVTALEQISHLLGRELPIKEGLEAVQWPGRMEPIRTNPPIVFDCAHNPCGAKALNEALRWTYPDTEIGVLFGFLNDKDAAGILKALKPTGRHWWGAPLSGERAMSTAQLSEAVRQAGVPAVIEEDPGTAIAAALHWVKEHENRMLCVTGSFHCTEWLAGLRE